MKWRRYEIPVFEEVDEGFDSRYQSQAVGTFGYYGVISFNGVELYVSSKEFMGPNNWFNIITNDPY